MNIERHERERIEAMRLIHKIFSLMGYSFGGYKSCLKHGCKDYCGYSPTEAVLFYEKGLNIEDHEEGLATWN